MNGHVRRKLVALAGTAALLSTVLAGTVAAQESTAPVVEAARQITNDPSPSRSFIIPQVAVDPTDSDVVVVAVGDYRNGGCNLYVSGDGGLVWSLTTRSLLPDGYDFCIQRPFGRAVSPAFAPDGTLYVGLSGAKTSDSRGGFVFPNAPEDSFIARTSDLGLTHETVMVNESQAIDTETDNGTEQAWEQHRHASIAFDPNDPEVMYFGSRQQSTPSPSHQGFIRGVFTVDALKTQVSVSTDGGQTWSGPIDVAEAASGLDEPLAGSDIAELEVGPDGTVYAFTKERAAGGGDGPPPANRLFMFTSTDQGQTWTASVIHPGSNRIDRPDSAIDPDSGNLYITWQEQGDDSANPAVVYFSASEDGGDTWSEPISLIDTEARERFNQYDPGISVAPDGRIDVAWYDFRDDPFFEMGEGGAHSAPNERYADIYMTSSYDGGRTWEPNVRVTDRSIDTNLGVTFTGANRGPIGIASTANAAYLTWPDTRASVGDTGTEDAYFTRVRFSEDAVAGASGGSSSLLWALLGAAGALVVAGLALFVVGRGRSTTVAA